MCGPVRRRQARRPGPDRRGVPSAAETGRMAVGQFREVERSYFDLRWHLDAVAATQAGVTAHDHRFGRFSPAALAPHLAALKSISAALEEAAVPSLDDEIDRTALLNDIRVTVRRLERERPQAKNPGFWLSHLLGGLHFLMLRRDRTAAERLAAATDAAVAALGAFTRDLWRWLETASDHFALGEDDFNFRLHYEHVLRDTAPELWRYGLHLKEEVEADLAARARRLDGRGRWHDVVD